VCMSLEVYSGLQMMSEMKWTLTQQLTTNVSVMAMTVYPTFGQSLLVDGILLVLFIPM